MTKLSKVLSLFLTLSVLIFSACGDDDLVDEPDDFPPIDRGDIQANRYFLTFTQKSDTSKSQTVEFYDPDGIGGAAPITRELLELKKPSGSFFYYSSSIKIFNDSVDVTDQVIAQQTEYIICYRGYDVNNLTGGDWNEDFNGIQLGTEGEWSTSDKLGNNGSGEIRVTLNYQPTGKDGLCDPGIRILDGSIPYQIN
ncbi:MAG: hypothetical protein RJQ00_07040 [Vicingaceae bacterium]